MKRVIIIFKTNKIYCMDNIVGIQTILLDESIDLTVTSPPYDDIRNYNGYTFNIDEIAKELYRVTKQGGTLVWIVGDRTVNGSESGSSFSQALAFKEAGFNLHDTMIYMKDSIAFPETNRYYQIFEYMFVFTKGKIKTFNLIRDRENTSAGKKIKGRERQTDGSMKKRSNVNEVSKFGVRYNVWQYKTGYMKHTSDKIAYEHPAIFPESLAEDHILSWSNEGDVVLDPFMGSGTVAKMAALNDRQYIGFEISDEYVAISNRRLSTIFEEEVAESDMVEVGE